MDHERSWVVAMAKSSKKKSQNTKTFKKYFALYRILNNPKKFPKEMREGIIKTMTKQHHKGLDEAVKLVLNDDSVTIDDHSLKKLKKYKDSLREFHSHINAPDHQKKILKQKGGFLSILIPVLTSILGSVAAEGVSAAATAIRNHHHHK